FRLDGGALSLPMIPQKEASPRETEARSDKLRKLSIHGLSFAACSRARRDHGGRVDWRRLERAPDFFPRGVITDHGRSSDPVKGDRKQMKYVLLIYAAEKGWAS